MTKLFSALTPNTILNISSFNLALKAESKKKAHVLMFVSFLMSSIIINNNHY